MGYTRKSFLQLIGVGTAFANVSSGLKQTTGSFIKPKKLKKGDTIGLISPGFSLPDENQYREIEKKIAGLGFRVKRGKHATEHYGYFAGTDKNRAADINTMFADSEVDGIMCFRGGWGCDRLLDYIDFDTIRNYPKPLIGFSDITALLLSIYAKTGLITFHGPLGVSEWTPFTTSYFEKALIKAQPFTMKNMDSDRPADSIHTIREGKATGKILGGNLSVLSSMLGSDYLPGWDGCLLFLEDVGEDVYRIDRMLTQLHLNGIFEKINGFIFGKCTDCAVQKERYFTLEQILDQHIGDYNIPAFFGANIGHISNIFTLPLGMRAQMDAFQGTIRILDSPVKE
jgi:muramoyltetrapeptide carboxypeptidase